MNSAARSTAAQVAGVWLAGASFRASEPPDDERSSPADCSR